MRDVKDLRTVGGTITKTEPSQFTCASEYRRAHDMSGRRRYRYNRDMELDHPNSNLQPTSAIWYPLLPVLCERLFIYENYNDTECPYRYSRTEVMEENICDDTAA